METSGKLRKSWCEKLADSKDMPKVVTIEGKMSLKWGSGTVCIPAPVEVDEVMRRVPAGRLVTVNQIRETLARKHGATIGCPITTGIFISISARAAEETVAEGGTDITPYWRTLKSGGELNEKYPGGVEAQAMRLRQEGHVIETDRAGKPKRVKDFKLALVEI
ncbi:MAG: methylated DNA-protein cysteine methyltransferase [Dehalococcoidales bacterium]